MSTARPPASRIEENRPGIMTAFLNGAVRVLLWIALVIAIMLFAVALLIALVSGGREAAPVGIMACAGLGIAYLLALLTTLDQLLAALHSQPDLTAQALRQAAQRAKQPAGNQEPAP
jgi:hypothetical protein